MLFNRCTYFTNFFLLSSVYLYRLFVAYLITPHNKKTKKKKKFQKKIKKFQKKKKKFKFKQFKK